MEPVTHFLTGACLARAGFNRKTALATVTMTLAAEASDIDILAYVRGSSFGFAHHRGFTHTVWGIPLVAALTLALVYGVRRLWHKLRPPRAGAPQPRWGLLYLFACIAGYSHLVLDLTNNYGVRLFWPFYNHWFSWDLVYILEPVMLLLLIAALLLPALFGLISSEVGARHKGPRGRGWAVAALCGIVVLWCVRGYEHARAIAALNSLEYQGQVARRVGAMPMMIDPFHWYGLVETDGSYISVSVNSLTPEVDPNGHEITYYKTAQTEALRRAQATYTGRAYMDWAQWPYLEEQQLSDPDGATEVVFRDLRFATVERRTNVLGAYVDLDKRLKVIDEGFLSRHASTERLRGNDDDSR